MKAYLNHIQYYLPKTVLNNDELAERFPEWSAEKIEEKVGIVRRHLALDESVVDMAEKAAEQLFADLPELREQIDFVLFCTQSPMYVLPSSACVLQDRLKLSTELGALDYDLGCSGYPYGLALAKGLVLSGQANTVLLITAEKYSQYIDSSDRGLNTLFGDAASASIISSQPVGLACSIGDALFGTDGAGAEGLIVKHGENQHLTMDGPGILIFTLKEVPRMLERLLVKSGDTIDSIDHFIFHQANTFILEKLREKIGIPEEKFIIDVAEYGNTVSSTIPIALSNLKTIKPGQTIMLVGFGVGLSWSAIILNRL